MIYLFKNANEMYDPFYQVAVSPFPWEFELLQSAAVKRLKFLSHYGTASFITPAKHSRYEHTIGVWTIISRFFPEEEELRIAALLHDIGHLPFSHAVEKTLGFNHHTITEEYIRGHEVSSILQKYEFNPERIIDILNEDSPLSHKTPYLSADHLDSFLRDSYMLGKSKEHPADILKKISFSGQYVESDLETSKSIMASIYHDHTCFLHPINLALDSLLAKAISIFVKKEQLPLHTIQPLTNHELLQLLLSSKEESVKEIMKTIMWNPENVIVQAEEFNGSEKIEVKKVYDKTPLVEGVPLTSICPDSKDLLEKIRALKTSYFMKNSLY